MAQLNLKRHEQMFQFVVLLYVSVPVTLVLGLAEVMPESLVALAMKNQFMAWYLVCILTVGALIYLVGLWRARQLTGVLELWRIERARFGSPPAI